jgi:hypothetical protein
MASLIRNIEPAESAEFAENSAVISDERQPHAAGDLPEAQPVVIHADAAPVNLTVDSTLQAQPPFCSSMEPTDATPAHVSDEPRPRADVIARVRILIAGGYYDRPGFIDLLAEHIEAGLNRPRW